MKRIKENYHTLDVLKHAHPKLRKAIISNCDRDLENCISECVLKVLNGNVALTCCVNRKLSKHKLALRKNVDRQVHITGKTRLIFQRGGFILPLLAAILPTLASQVTLGMLHKMYLVPAKDDHPSPPPAMRRRSRPSRRRQRPTNRTPTLSGLSCALSIAKLNYGVMHGQRRLLIM